MPRTSSKTLTFPMGGVIRRNSYREQVRPFSAPWAVNVRGLETMEDRNRGGSRPGLSLVADVTETDVEAWQWEDGEIIEWDDIAGPPYDPITFALPQTRYETPEGEIISPATLILVNSDVGVAPEDYEISCYYRDRVIIGKDNLWYASRAGNHSDWDYGAEMTDAGRAVYGSVELAGRIGNNLTAIIPHRDRLLLLSTKNSLHLLEGDPVTGSMRTMEEDIGIVSPYAWAFDGEVLAFLSNDGVYIGPIGSKPQRFSEGRIPDELKNVDVDNNDVSMAYDPNSRGFYLFITPASGDGSHYYFEIENGAMWPIVFGDPNHQPTIAARIKSDNLERVMVRGRDGSWREFKDDATDDHGVPIESHVLIGPVRVAGSDTHDSMLAELHGLMGDIGVDEVTWRIVVDDSAEAAADRAVADVYRALDGDPLLNVAASGTWSGGRNSVVRPRSRGMWLVVWLSSETQWSYEAIATVSRQFGRTRP